MVNFFDQFDAQQATPQASGNFFDQFDAPTNSPQKADFISRVKGDFANRMQEGAQSADAFVNGQESYPSHLLQTIGKPIVGTALDTAGEVAKSLIPDSVAQAASSGAQSLANKIDDTGIGQGVGNVALGTRNAYQDFAQNNPVVARNLESLGNIASVAPVSELAKPVLGAAGAISDATGGLLSKAGRAIGDSADLKSATSLVDADTLKSFSKQAYQQADALGGSIAPNVTNKWLDAAKDALPQTPAGKLANGETAATQYADRIQALRDQPLSFQSAEEIDKGLGNEIQKAYRSGDKVEAARFSTMQDGLRDAVSTLPDTSDAVTTAKGLFSAQARVRKVEGILDNASKTDNPASAIRTGFKNLSKRAEKLGYQPNEISAINNAAKTGIVTDALRIAGSRLGPIAAASAGLAAGGPLGALGAGAADYFLSGAARNIASARQASRASSVIDAIKSRPVVQDAIQNALASGQIQPKLTAQKALGVTLDTTGKTLRLAKPLSALLKP